MPSHMFTDKPLLCSGCEDLFVFSAGEQELHAVRGVTARPRYCSRCRRDRLDVAARRRTRFAATLPAPTLQTSTGVA
jgi:hypothetical protein